MAGKRHFWTSRFLIIVLLGISCIVNMHTSNQPAGLSEGRRLIDMSLEELMTLSVMPVTNGESPSITEGAENKRILT